MENDQEKCWQHTIKDELEEVNWIKKINNNSKFFKYEH